MTPPPADPAADDSVYDIVVIGGGINGCGIARDAAGRGYSVLLAEMNDLASGTSSASTKLIHGGLRYLEHYHFGLVRKALIEREIIWANAPHIVWPLRFVLPHHSELRPRWLLRLGLFLYDNLGGRRLLPPTATLKLRHVDAGKPLKISLTSAFEYSDCWVDDARFVTLNARDAADRGADIRTRTEITALSREGGLWQVDLRPTDGAPAYRARARLVQGSHIVVPRLYDEPHCYIFQNADGRIVFAIPYEDDFTMIGTTDRDYPGDPAVAAISPEEIDYLCSTVSEYFAAPVTPDDVVWTFTGVRPLFDDGASSAKDATRDYVLRQDGDAESGALINVFGGKITTYRKLAESVMEKVAGTLGDRGQRWTLNTPLPGGEFPVKDVGAERESLIEDYPFLDEAFAARLFRTYGRRARSVLGTATEKTGLGRHFGADLYESEVRYLVREEWAKTAEDILWRRTKRGLKLSPSQADELERFLAEISTETKDIKTGV